jgi:hypothetical protein
MCRRLKTYIVLLALLVLPSLAFAAEVKLTWNPNTETDLAGYRIYQSNTSQTYNRATNKVADIPALPNQTKVATLNVTPEDGRPVYFVATVYDTSGNESGNSNEVVWTVKDSIPPTPPSMLSVLQEIANALQSLATDGMKIKIVE